MHEVTPSDTEIKLEGREWIKFWRKKNGTGFNKLVNRDWCWTENLDDCCYQGRRNRKVVSQVRSAKSKSLRVEVALSKKLFICVPCTLPVRTQYFYAIYISSKNKEIFWCPCVLHVEINIHFIPSKSYIPTTHLYFR